MEYKYILDLRIRHMVKECDKYFIEFYNGDHLNWHPKTGEVWLVCYGNQPA